MSGTASNPTTTATTPLPKIFMLGSFSNEGYYGDENFGRWTTSLEEAVAYLRGPAGYPERGQNVVFVPVPGGDFERFSRAEDLEKFWVTGSDFVPAPPCPTCRGMKYTTPCGGGCEAAENGSCKGLTSEGCPLGYSHPCPDCNSPPAAPRQCHRCGDYQARPGSWFGVHDLDSDGTPHNGGLGGCGDLHDWR